MGRYKISFHNSSLLIFSAVSFVKYVDKLFAFRFNQMIIVDESIHVNVLSKFIFLILNGLTTDD